MNMFNSSMSSVSVSGMAVRRHLKLFQIFRFLKEFKNWLKEVALVKYMLYVHFFEMVTKPQMFFQLNPPSLQDYFR